MVFARSSLRAIPDSFPAILEAITGTTGWSAAFRSSLTFECEHGALWRVETDRPRASLTIELGACAKGRDHRTLTAADKSPAKRRDIVLLVVYRSDVDLSLKISRSRAFRDTDSLWTLF